MRYNLRHALRYTFFLLTGIAWCQSGPDVSVGGALRSLASRAGVVFVGQVVKIEPKPGMVEVTFRVEQQVQGAVGGSYTLREWAGLWANGQPRYVLGQRAMVFLHAPGASGLSTPVDGMEGVVPLVATTADASPMLDVRWVGTRVQRSVGAPMVAAMVSLEDAMVAAQSAKEPVLRGFPIAPKPLPVVPVRILRGVNDELAEPAPRAPGTVQQPMVRDAR